MKTNLRVLCGMCHAAVPQHDGTLPTPEPPNEIIYIIHPRNMWCPQCGQAYMVVGYRVVVKQVSE